MTADPSAAESEVEAEAEATEDTPATTFAHLRPLATKLPVVEPTAEPPLALDAMAVDEPIDPSPLDTRLDRLGEAGDRDRLGEIDDLDRLGDAGELTDELSLPFEVDEPELDSPPIPGGVLGLGSESGGPQREAAQYALSHLDRAAGRSWKDRRRSRLPVAASIALLAAGLSVGGLTGYVVGYWDADTSKGDVRSTSQASAKPPESSREPVTADSGTPSGESARVWSEAPMSSESAPPKPKPPAPARPEASTKASPKPAPPAANRSRSARTEPPRRPPESEPEISAGRLLIRSTPANATVMIDGQPRGTTPLVLRDLPFGSYQISVQRDGYLNDTRLVRLSRVQPSTTTTFELTPLPRRTSLDAQARLGGSGRP